MIDTSIQFNNHNSYKATEDFWQKPFGVELMTHITIAAIFYATSPQAEANRIRVIFLDENGARVQVSNHAIGIGIDAARQSVTVAVPAGAKQAQIGFLAGNYWWAEAKAEEGETATAYAINAAGQLTYLTPNGIYTHTLQAKQIVITDKEALNDRLVTINQNHMALTDVVTGKTTKMTSDGVYTGEVVADQVKTGLLKSTNGASQINLGNGRFSFGDGALSWNGALLSLVGKFTSRLSATKPTRVEIENGQIKLTNALGNTVGQIDNWNAGALEGLNISTGANSKYLSFGHIVSGGGLLVDYYINLGENPSGATERHVFVGDARFLGKLVMDNSPIYVTTLRDAAGKDRLSIGSSTILSDAAGKDRLGIAASGDFTVYDNSGNLAIWISKSGNFAQLHLPSSTDNAIGVDATGAYKIKNGTKTYL